MNPKTIGIFVLLVVLCVFMSLYTPESFLKGNNIENLLRRTSMYGILGIGVAFVIITGGIDLSIGSVVCLAGCLLAMFLHVSYEPFNAYQVVRVDASEHTILVKGDNEGFQPGMRIRYYGGRRARNAILTVVSVEKVTDPDSGRTHTGLIVDQPLGRDDDEGHVARLTNVVSFERRSASDDTNSPLSMITLDAKFPDLRKRDKIWLVHTTAGLKQFKVVEVFRQNDRTTVAIDDTLGEFDERWMAIPLERAQRMAIPVAVGFVLMIALGLGLIHGLLVTKLKMQPFVVTLCGLLFYRGISRWMVNDLTMGFGDEYVESISMLGGGKLTLWQSSDGADSFGIPYPFLVLLVTAMAAAVFLNKTIWGRYMLALGRNEEAARYSGINTSFMTTFAYVISTFLAAVGGMLFALDSNSIAPSSFGNFFELYAIAAAVLGGCSLRGGEGGIMGVVIGTAVMQMLYNLIVLMRISDKLEFAIIGAVILLGVIADELVRRIAARRRSRVQKTAA